MPESDLRLTTANLFKIDRSDPNCVRGTFWTITKEKEMIVQKVNGGIWMPIFLVVLTWSLIGCATSQGQMSNTGTQQASAIAPTPNVLRVGVSTIGPPEADYWGLEVA